MITRRTEWRSPGLDEDLLYLMYEQMTQIRAVEELLLQLFSDGDIRGTVHTCIGQEACAVGVIKALDPKRDIVCSNHRGHGHFLAFTGDVTGLVAEIMGLPSGVCGGIGGSQHIHKGGFYSNGILGGLTPVAAGMALAEKTKESGAVATMFLGDGAFGEGVVYETLNIAALWKLPVLFAVEQNGYAQSTPWHAEHSGRLEGRAEPFGIPITHTDGNDVVAVYRAASQAITDIRGGGGPRLLFMQTYRLGPHSKGDDQRDPAEIETHLQGEPLSIARAHLDRDACRRIDERVRERVSSIVVELKTS